MTAPSATSDTSLAKSLVEQLTSGKPHGVTHAQIEQCMTEVDINPNQADDLYLTIIEQIEARGILVVEDEIRLEDVVDEDATAQQLADEIWEMLKQARLPLDEYQHPILTANRERRLLEVYFDGQRAQRELAREQSPAQHNAANRRTEAGAQAMDELVRCNLRLVIKAAYRFLPQARHLSIDDLIQEGRIGLVKAIDRYDLNLGHRLSTYATWWIRQSITRALADQDRTIRIPVHLTETLRRIWHTRQRMSMELGHEPGDDELAQQLGIPAQKLRHYLKSGLECISLDMRVRGDADTALGELIPDPWQASPEEIVDQQATQDLIRDALSHLSERERYVIEQRFGIVDGQKRTLEDIGQEIGVTRERIRQIEAKALKHLQKPSIKRGLRTLLP